MARPTYEEIFGNSTDEQVQEVFKPLCCQETLTVYQYWGG